MKNNNCQSTEANRVTDGTCTAETRGSWTVYENSINQQQGWGKHHFISQTSVIFIVIANKNI